MASQRTLIAQALIARLDAVTQLKSKSADVVRLLVQDFQDWELPAAQVIDLPETSQHEQGRAKKTWGLAIEIVIGPTATTPVQQTDLWDLMEIVEQTIFAIPQLNVPGVIQMRLLGSSTDLALLRPFYSGRIEVAVDYYQNLIGNC